MSGSFEQAFKSQLSSWRGSLQSGFSGASSSSNTNTNNSSDSILDKVASWNPFANNKYISLPITEPRSTPFSSTTTTNGVSPQAAAESAPSRSQRGSISHIGTACSFSAFVCLVLWPVLRFASSSCQFSRSNRASLVFCGL